MVLKGLVTHAHIKLIQPNQLAQTYWISDYIYGIDPVLKGGQQESNLFI